MRWALHIFVLVFCIGCATDGAVPMRGTYATVKQTPDYWAEMQELGTTKTAAAPYQVYIGVVAIPGGRDKGWFFTKAELDMGDGSGWTDVTVEAAKFYKHSGRDPEGYVAKLLGSGDYHIRTRITYYEGEVLEIEERATVHLHIDP